MMDGATAHRTATLGVYVRYGQSTGNSGPEADAFLMAARGLPL